MTEHARAFLELNVSVTIRARDRYGSTEPVAAHGATELTTATVADWPSDEVLDRLELMLDHARAGATRQLELRHALDVLDRDEAKAKDDAAHQAHLAELDELAAKRPTDPAA